MGKSKNSVINNQHSSCNDTDACCKWNWRYRLMRLLIVWCVMAGGAMFGGMTVAADIGQRHAYRIDGGTLAAALEQIEQTANVMLLYDRAALQQVQSPRLRGEYTAPEALSRLLETSGWRAEKKDGGYQLVAAADTSGTTSLPPVVANAAAEQAPGTVTVLSAESMSRRGVRNMGDIVREELLVSAPRVASSGRAGRSSFDRAGYTGYNIRGIEGSRIALNVDGVPLPNASGRPYASRDGANTFGIGRDYIDPELFSSVVINSGMSPEKLPSGGIGGSVSFRTKSPQDYLIGDKAHHVEYKATYNTVDESTSQALTLAGAYKDLSGLLVWSHREGRETANRGEYTQPINSSSFFGYGYRDFMTGSYRLNSVSSPPETWDSDALLAKLRLKINARHALGVTYDYLHRQSKVVDDTWLMDFPFDLFGTTQHGNTGRSRLSLEHAWTPDSAFLPDSINTQLYTQHSNARDRTVNVINSIRGRQFIDSGLDTAVSGFNIAAEKRIGRHHLAFGVDAAREQTERMLNAKSYLNYFRPVPIETINFLPPPQGNTTVNRIGGYVTDEISFDIGGHRAAIIPGLRYDHWVYDFSRNAQWDAWRRSRRGFVLNADESPALSGGRQRNRALSPQLGLTFDLKPDLMLYAQYKRGERPPGINESIGTWTTGFGYALVGNAKLKNERSTMYEVGIKGQLVPGVEIASAVFRSRYENFIDYVRYEEQLGQAIGIQYRPENRDTVIISGVEMSLKFNFGAWTPALRGWSARLGAGAVRSTVRNSDPLRSDQIAEQELSSAPPTKGMIRLAYDAPEELAGVALSMIAVKGKLPPQRTAFGVSGYQGAKMFRVPGYAVFDLSTYFKLGPHAYVQWQISNLLNKKHWNYSAARDLRRVDMDIRDIELRTEPGRSMLLSLGLKF